MNKRLVVVIVAVVAVVFIVILNVVFKKNGTVGDNNPCHRFIVALQAGDANATINMMTSNAQNQTSRNVWQKQANELKVAYINGTLTLKSTSDATPVGAKDKHTRYIYDVKSGSWDYTATCYVVNSQIDGFSSTVGKP